MIDLFRPRLIVSSNAFQFLFVHLDHNSALFLASCCCSVLLHIVTNVICICLVSCQLVLLSSLPKFIHYFCGQRGCALLFFSKISSPLTSVVFLSFLLSLPYKRLGTASALSTFILEYFSAKFGFKELFNPLNAELNPICHLLALLGGATIVVVSRLRVKIPNI